MPGIFEQAGRIVDDLRDGWEVKEHRYDDAGALLVTQVEYGDGTNVVWLLDREESLVLIRGTDEPEEIAIAEPGDDFLSALDYVERRS